MPADLPRSLVVLSGGGTRGVFQVGPLERIARETRISAVVGASIGAENGYAVATGNVGQIREMWADVRRGEDFQRLTLTPFNGLYTLDPLFKMLAAKDWGTPEIPFWVSVVDWMSGRPQLMGCNGRPLDHVFQLMRASSSIAGIHDVVSFDGRPIGDGGHDTPLPVPGRWWQDYDEVHVVSCRPLEDSPPVPAAAVDRSLELIMRWADRMTTLRLRDSWRRLKRMAKGRPDIPFYFSAPKSWAVVHPTFPRKNRDLRAAIKRGLAHSDYMAEHRIQL